MGVNYRCFRSALLIQRGPSGTFYSGQPLPPELWALRCGRVPHPEKMMNFAANNPQVG